MTAHFYFPKMLGQVKLSTAAIAVYPALCLSADFEKENTVQLSRENMAKMVGITPMSADRGIRDLGEARYENRPLVIRRMTNVGRRRFYIYRPFFIRKPMMEAYRGKFFPFHRCLVDTGVWADLKPRAKALYLALRQTSFFDFDLYSQIEDDVPDSPEDFDWHKDGYRERKWETNLKYVAELCRLVDIDRFSIEPTLTQLEEYGLIHRVDRYFMVYLRPEGSGE